jgi:hypothetical protein
MPDLNTCPANGVTTTTAGPTTSTTSTVPSTTTAEAMCEEDQLPYMVVYRSFKRSKNWSDCRDACNDDSECQYFKWKNVRKWQKRTCYLMKISYRAKKNWVSGARFCGSQ